LVTRAARRLEPVRVAWVGQTEWKNRIEEMGSRGLYLSLLVRDS